MFMIPMSTGVKRNQDGCSLWTVDYAIEPFTPGAGECPASLCLLNAPNSFESKGFASSLGVDLDLRTSEALPADFDNGMSEKMLNGLSRDHRSKGWRNKPESPALGCSVALRKGLSQYAKQHRIQNHKSAFGVAGLSKCAVTQSPSSFGTSVEAIVHRKRMVDLSHSAR